MRITALFYCRLSAILFLLPIAMPAFGQGTLLDIMQDELQHEFEVLQKEETPPYFMSYSVSDVFEASVSTEFGVLVQSTKEESRLCAVEVRVGDYTMDNTREIRGDMFANIMSGMQDMKPLPLDSDNETAIRQALWKETNKTYRDAIQRYAKVKSNVAVKVEAEDQSDDFAKLSQHANSIAPPVDPHTLLPDLEKWETKLKSYSAPFLELETMYQGDASFSFRFERKYYVSTEGAKLASNRSYARLFINGMVKAEDGMELPLYKTYSSFTPDEMPSDEEIIADVKAMISKMKALKEAPVVNPYTGPAILSGRAAGVFFHEIFGHRIEGHRQKQEDEGQTFKKKVDQQILPEFMDVYSDPTQSELNGTKLLGYYEYDDQGVKAEKVPVVVDGVFKNFLMARSPIEGFPASNGHGRAEAGYKPVSRQSNLLVTTDKPISKEELRELLIDECKKQEKEFGLLFEDIQGGFTMTGRTIPNAFNVIPTEVYRIYTDGRPDELVRGVDLVGTPLVMFSNITATGSDMEIFNGRCGAESGWVPVSAASPSLFVSQVEVQKKSKSQERPPLLPRPDADASSSDNTGSSF